MKAILLAAGRGSRINSETKFHPKCLTIFRSKTLLEHSLFNLKQFLSADQILIIGGYKSEMLKEYISNILINKNWATSNIMASLSVAKDFLRTEECLIVYSDIYFEPEAISLMINNPYPSVLSVVDWQKIWNRRFTNPLEDLENFVFDKENYLTNIGGRANNMKEIMGQFGGIFTLNPCTWQQIENFGSDLYKMDSTTCLNKLISVGVKIQVINYSGNWAEIDRIEDIKTS